MVRLGLFKPKLTEKNTVEMSEVTALCEMRSRVLFMDSCAKSFMR